MDAMTYRELYNDASNTIDTAKLFIIKQQGVIQQGQKTVDAKDGTAAFYKSQAEMRAIENTKLEKLNRLWRVLAGLSTAVAGVLIIKNL